MESVKRSRTRSKTEVEGNHMSDTEINGEKAISETEEATTNAMEVVESETAEKCEEKDGIESVKISEKIDENSDNDKEVFNNMVIQEEAIEKEVIEREAIEKEVIEKEVSNKEALEKDDNSKTPLNKDNEPVKKSRKRKVSEISKEENSVSKSNTDETKEVSDTETSKEVIEDENALTIDLKKEEMQDKDSSPELNLPAVQGFGKGKRARIPNKRYSDIALSPTTKIVKPTYLENGDKEKIVSALPIERIESETSRNSSPTPTPKKQKTSSIDLANPNFLKPFKLGWKRELVWRSTGDIAGKRMGDIYYYSPKGKKLRSMREVAEVLKGKDLVIDNFTFFKEPLGVNDPDKEIIRDAKVKGGPVTPIIKKSSTPKPKKLLSPKVMSPKIMSPKVMSPKLVPASSTTLSPKLRTPRVTLTKLEHMKETKSPKTSKASANSTSKGTNTTADSVPEEKTEKSSTLKVKLTSKTKVEKKPTSNKQVAATGEEDVPMVGKKVPPRKSGKWSQNTGASGDFPKPCQPCSIRCQGVQGLVPTLQCRLCLCLYHNECVGMVPNINIPNYVCKNCQLEQGGQNMSTGIAPPPLTPITALQSVTTQPTALPKLQRIPKSPELETTHTTVVETEKTESIPVPSVENTNTSILGHVTSWLPQNSRIQDDNQQRNVGEITEPARPQYVEFLGGRKFLIIPKYNVVSVSPTGIAVKSVEPSQAQEAIDIIPAQTADGATVKTEPISPSKPENSQTPDSIEPRPEPMEVDDIDVKPDVQITDLNSSEVPVTSESTIKTVPAKKTKTLKLNNITNQLNDKAGDSTPMNNFLQNLSYGYSSMLYVFQYLKVQDLLRAGCVCTMWRDMARHTLLWRTVRMKNSQVHSFEGLANTLQKHQTEQLDLRKMLLNNGDERWPEFSDHIGKVDSLRKIELCRCPASVVEKLTETNPKLEVVNAVTIKCETMNLEGLANWTNLRELRLKSTTGLTLKSDIDSLKSLVNLNTMSLTSIRDLNTMKLDVIAELTNLKNLDLGECTDFPENFGRDILSKLMQLEKLRLEKGQGNCHTFEILDAVKDMTHLEQLELVNFDIKVGFDKALGACKNVKKLLIIPTYISQSATTNHMVLGGVLRLQKSLSHFVWGVTLELLRVTELFVDQCEEPEKKEKKEKKVVGNGDSIPVLKPVPLITDDKSDIPPALDPPQVEILALPGLQKLLLQSLPTTRVKILKIPFHATWRQSITDAVN